MSATIAFATSDFEKSSFAASSFFFLSGFISRMFRWPLIRNSMWSVFLSMLAFLIPNLLPTRLSSLEGSSDDSRTTAPTKESSYAKSGSDLPSFSFGTPHFTLFFVADARLSNLFTKSPKTDSIVT